MPMVTICPRRLNVNNLLYNLMSSIEKDLREENVREVETILYREMISQTQERRTLNFYSSPTPNFETCLQEKEIHTARCEFANTLAALAHSISFTYQGTDLLLDFLTESYFSPEPVTTSILNVFLHTRFNIQNVTVKDKDILRTKEITMKRFYSMFFPLEEQELKGLDQYKAINLSPTNTQDHKSVMAYMIDRGFMQSVFSVKGARAMNKIVENYFFEALGNFLEFKTNESHKMIDIINSFVYKPDLNYFFTHSTDNTPTAPTTNPCSLYDDVNYHQFETICSNATSMTCQSYCNTVMKYSNTSIIKKYL